MVLLAIDFTSDRLSHREEHELACRMRDELLKAAYGTTQFDFAVRDGGKPYIKGHPATYSITHTYGCISCAISANLDSTAYPLLPDTVTEPGIYAVYADFPCEIGYDIEYENPLRSADMIFGVSKKFFTDSEVLRLRSAEDSNKEFFKIWTAKESYVKCTGDGMKSVASTDVASLDSSYTFRQFAAVCDDRSFSCSVCIKTV